MSDQLQKAYRIFRSTAEIERAALDALDISPGRDIGLNRVTNEQNITDLVSIAIDRDRVAAESALDEMGDPALLLRPHLPWAIDTTHPHYSCRQAEAAGVIEDVLVGGTL